MPDGASRRDPLHEHTRAEQKRINAVIASVCVSAVIMFILIFAPLMALREVDVEREREIQADEYQMADNWTNVFRLRLMDASYAGNMVAGLVLSENRTLPPLDGTPEEKVAGQFVSKFSRMGLYLFSSLPTIAHLYLSPGGIINQCYPQACTGIVRDLLNMSDPANIYTPTGPEIASSGQIGYVGPVRNTASDPGTKEWVIQARLPIYIAPVKADFDMTTFWGFSSTTINVTAIIQNNGLRDSMNKADMDYLLFRVGSRTGTVYVIACHFAGCDSDGSGVNENAEIIPSQEALKAFMVTGSGAMRVLQASSFAITVCSRKNVQLTTPSSITTIVMGGVGVGLLYALVCVALIMWRMLADDGSVSPAPKQAPFAVVTIGPSRADVLWRDAPEIMNDVADDFVARLRHIAHKHHGYVIPRVHPYTHSYATRTVSDAIQIAFDMLSWGVAGNEDGQLLKKLGARHGCLLIACTVHWCTDATVRLSSLSDPFPYRYEGPDVERAGHIWVVSAPNTVTVTQAALDHLDHYEPARKRRSLTVVPYLRMQRASTNASDAHIVMSAAGSVAVDGPLSLPASASRLPRQRLLGSGDSGAEAGHSARDDDSEDGNGGATTAKKSEEDGAVLYLVTDPQQKALCQAIKVAQLYRDVPADDGMSVQTERFDQWNNVRPVSGSSSEAGGDRWISDSSRASTVVAGGLGSDGAALEASTRGVESDIQSPLLMTDSGVGYSPGHADLSGASLSVLPSSTITSAADFGEAGASGPLSLSFSGSASNSSTPLTRTVIRPSRTAARNPGVVINVSQGMTTALEVRDDPLGHVGTLGPGADRHDVEGTPLTDLQWDTGFARPLQSFPRPSSASTDTEEKMSGSGPAPAVARAARTNRRTAFMSSSSSSDNESESGVQNSRPGSVDGDGDDDAARRQAGLVPRICAYEARYQRRTKEKRDRADSSGHSSSDHLHMYTERLTRASRNDSHASVSWSHRHSTTPGSSSKVARDSDDGDAVTQILLHPPIPKYLDDSLRSAFQYQAVGLPLPYDAVQVLMFYIYNGYKLLFRPLATAERSNIFQRFVVAFGVPSTNTLDHLAAWAAIRYVEQHEETHRLCAPVAHYVPVTAASLTTDRIGGSHQLGSSTPASSAPPPPSAPRLSAPRLTISTSSDH